MNILVGRLVLRRTYNASQIIAVMIITLGLCWSTTAATGAGSSEPTDMRLDMIGGVVLLTLALLANALLGASQEVSSMSPLINSRPTGSPRLSPCPPRRPAQVTFKRFGLHRSEAIFVQHILGLPLLILGASDTIRRHGPTWATGGAHIWELAPGVKVPEIWILVACNLVVNHGAKMAICGLTAHSSSLNTQYATTLYRFASVIISAFFVENGASNIHMWLGVAMVFVGIVICTRESSPVPKKNK